jgi:hypothetical protein
MVQADDVRIHFIRFKQGRLMGRYIGDAKFGRHVGTDELGNRYFENMNPSEEVPGMSHMLQTEEGGKTDV